MNLSEFFKKVVDEFDAKEISYALAGGMLASVYRKAPRSTMDLDFLIFTKKDHLKISQDLIKGLGLNSYILRKADLEGGPMFAIKKKSTPPMIVAGRAANNQAPQMGLDLILPEVPWSEGVVERAQFNKIDFGFGGIPCLTVEDFIISKFYSFNNQSTRFMDLDDLKSVFESDIRLDNLYLCSRVIELKLKIPEVLNPFIPKEILTLIKKQQK
jgi:hypothetical protein